MIKADLHIHSSFSNDSKTDIDLQIKRALDIGLDNICITDHYDMEYPSRGNEIDFKLDMEEYTQRVRTLKEKYRQKINILYGIELGLIPLLKERIHAYVKKYCFDFIIGSSHMVNGKDPCFEEFYNGRTKKEAYTEYFESILQNVKIFNEYNVYGHLDYVVRYGPNKNKYFDFNDYKNIFKELLTIIINNNKGIEINTSGIAKNLGYPHPHNEILKMYRQLGGKIITIGSDAHTPDKIMSLV